MINNVIHTTGKLQDRQIINLIEELRSRFGFKLIQFYYGVILIPHEDISDIIGNGISNSISSALLDTENYIFKIQYLRGTCGHDASGNIQSNLRIPSPYFDEIIITPNKNANPQGRKVPTPQECMDLEAIVAKYVSSHVPKEVGAGANNAIDLLQKEMADLTAFHKTMLEDAEKQRRKLDADYQKKHNDLSAKATADHEANIKFSKEENSKLDKKKRKLDKARKELDDRNPMHVRRDLREKITNDIGEKVSGALLPTKTLVMQWSIFLFTLSCAGIAGWIAYESYSSFSELVTLKSGGQNELPENFNWQLGFILVRGTVASGVTIGFLVYALSWMRKNYLENVRISNDLQRYALDINRASWTIETIMEMSSKDENQLPDEWMRGVCHGLFSKNDGEKKEITPLDAWGTLLNVSGKVEYGPDGPKMSFSKGQARKLAKGLEVDS